YVPESSALLVLALLIFYQTGCVSTGTFQMKVDENAALSQDLQNAQAIIDQLKQQAEELQRRNVNLEDELRGNRKAKKGLEKRIKDMDAKLDNLKESVSESEQRFRSVQKETTETLLSRNEEWELEKEELLASRDAKESEVNRLAAENHELKKSLQEVAIEKEKKARELEEAGRTHREFVRKLTDEINDGVIKISKLKNRLSVEIVDSILFDSGSVDIKGAGQEVLKKVSKVLMKVKENDIRVEGHTDNIPIGKGLKHKYPSNWELSAARATGVVRYLILQGVPPEILVPVGFSRFKPVASNDSPAGRRTNRRIEIVLFPRDIEKIVRSVEVGGGFK
ncbi:MAG: OmpA family protein, partial [Nitrospinota bacterium]